MSSFVSKSSMPQGKVFEVKRKKNFNVLCRKTEFWGVRKRREEQLWCAFSSFSDTKCVQQCTDSDFPSLLRITPLISAIGDLYSPQLWRSLQIQTNTSNILSGCVIEWINGWWGMKWCTEPSLNVLKGFGISKYALHVAYGFVSNFAVCSVQMQNCWRNSW